VDKLTADNEIVVLFLGQNDKDYDTFDKVSKTYEDVVFAHSFTDDLRLAYQSTDSNKIVLIKKFDEEKAEFTGPFVADTITDFIENNEFPTVMPFSQKVAEKIFGDNTACLFMFLGDDEKSTEARKLLDAVALEVKGKLLISFS
jgi:hypothetical protein